MVPVFTLRRIMGFILCYIKKNYFEEHPDFIRVPEYLFHSISVCKGIMI